MFADPLSVTINAVPVSLPRTNMSGEKCLYTAADANHTLTISHQVSGTRRRHMIRLDSRVVAEDPISAVNSSQTMGAYLVMDIPSFGFSTTDIQHAVAGLLAFITDANVAKVVGGES